MLARKSRKNLPEKTIVISKTLRVAGYVRLSVMKADQPSESIENQKKIIQEFIDVQPDMELQEFYVDEKASGTNFDRVAFTQMLNDIDKGEIDCVIVKDLSRLGRSLIDVGYYLQMHFPKKNVRLISVNDMIDTLDGITNLSFGKLSGTKIPLTTLLDEEYSNDISRKTQSVIDSYVQDGKYVAPRAPYGYRKSDTDCHKLIPDSEAAAVVKEIFSLISGKVSVNEVVRRLNVSKTPSPISYAIANGLEGNYNRGNGLWNSRTVKNILTNRTYIGDLAQGKDNCLVENTHEPLVSREIFNRVQELFTSPMNSNINITNIPRADNVLRGKIICGSCGGKMQRRKGSGKGDWYFFTCITNNRLGAGHCSGMYIRESDIMDAIRAEVGRYVEVNRGIALAYESRKVELENKAAGLNLEHNVHLEKSRKRYEDFIMGIADEDDFKQRRGELETVQSKLQEIEAQITSQNREHEQYQLFCNVFQDKQEIGRFVNAYLKSVTVYGDRNLDVQLEV